ncbi:MAG: PPC domain-containing protein [Phycisphaerae bacterium]
MNALLRSSLMTLAAALVALTAAAPASAAHDLNANQTVGPLSGWARSKSYFRVYVPAGADSLVVRTSGGSGDVDLYIRTGTWPTTADYQHRSVGKATDERIAIPNPTRGWYYVMLHAYRGYAGVSLVARTDADDDDDHDRIITLRDGSIVRNLRGSNGTRRCFRVEVPHRSERLTIVTQGGSGDADLYLRRAAVPSTSTYDYRSVGKWANERISVGDPTPGTWYVMLRGYRDFSGVTLTADLEGDDADDDWDHDWDDDWGHVGRWIRFSEPDGGENWTLGRQYTVRFRAGSNVERVKLYYSRNDGSTWMRYGNRTWDADDGSIAITLPRNRNLVTSRARLRLVDTEGSNVSATSGRFEVRYDGNDDRHRGDAYEPDDRSGSPTALPLNRRQTHTINPAGDEDWFSFRPRGGDTYHLGIVRTSIELRAQVWSYTGGLPKLVGTYKDLRAGGGLRIRTTDDTQLLKVRIWGEDDDDRGMYSVVLTRTATRRDRDHGRRRRRPIPRPTQPTRTADDSRLNPTPIALNGTVRGSVRAGDGEDWIRFVPRRKGTYAFTIRADKDLRGELWVNQGKGDERAKSFNVDEGTTTSRFKVYRGVTYNVKLRLKAKDDDKTTYSVKLTQVGS